MNTKQNACRVRRIALALVVCCLIGWTSILGVSAAGPSFPKGSVPTEVHLDGREVLAGECVIIDSITYVPLRNFCDLFDENKITWNGRTATATVENQHLTLTVQSGALYIIANGRYFYTVGEVKNLGGHLYVPIRPLARALDIALSWNAAARRVELTSPKDGVYAADRASYASDEVYWLSRIISAEAAGEPFRGQIAVGNVVLNRVKSRAYPNTIYGVIFDRKHGTQFSPVSFGTIYKTPTASAVAAAKICLEGYSLSDEILFFVNPRIATSTWIERNCTYEFTVGNHNFYS